MPLLAVTGEEPCLCELVDSLRQPKYRDGGHYGYRRKSWLRDIFD